MNTQQLTKEAQEALLRKEIKEKALLLLDLKKFIKQENPPKQGAQQPNVADIKEKIELQKLLEQYEHLGILGKGRDHLLQLSCSINMVLDKTEKKRYGMQVYSNLTAQVAVPQVENIVSLSKIGQQQGLCPLKNFSILRHNEKYYDISIIYDIEECQGLVSLENIMNKRKADKQFWSQGEIFHYFEAIGNLLLKYSLNCDEYLDITPVNIFVVEKEQAPNDYFISNFNLHFKNTKWDKKYQCPSDTVFTDLAKDKNSKNYLKSNVFVMGIFALCVCTGWDSNVFFSEMGKNVKVNMIAEALERIDKNSRENEKKLKLEEKKIQDANQNDQPAETTQPVNPNPVPEEPQNEESQGNPNDPKKQKDWPPIPDNNQIYTKEFIQILKEMLLIREEKRVYISDLLNIKYFKDVIEDYLLSFVKLNK